MYYYMNITTGELFTKKEALEIWCNEYDGNDPTNDLPFSEIFEKTKIKVKEDNKMRKFDDALVTCSAKLVDWVEMNKLAKKNVYKHYEYLGNFLAEEDNEAYALFNEIEVDGENCYYCVRL